MKKFIPFILMLLSCCTSSRIMGITARQGRGFVPGLGKSREQ